MEARVGRWRASRFQCIYQLLDWLRLLVAILYMVAGVMLFVGLGLVYNLDKKTLATMNAELEARRGTGEAAAEEADAAQIAAE